MDGRGATRPFASRQTGIIGPRSPILIRRDRTFPEGDAQVSLLAISIRFFCILLPSPFLAACSVKGECKPFPNCLGYDILL